MAKRSNLSSPVCHEIRYLVKTLGASKKASSNVNSELERLIQIGGTNARLFYVVCLLQETDFKDTKKEAARAEALSAVVAELVSTGELASFLTEALALAMTDEDSSLKLNEDFATALVRCLNLGAGAQLGLGLALYGALEPLGVSFLSSKIVQIVGECSANPADAENDVKTELASVDEEEVHALCCLLRSNALEVNERTSAMAIDIMTESVSASPFFAGIAETEFVASEKPRSADPFLVLSEFKHGDDVDDLVLLLGASKDMSPQSACRLVACAATNAEKTEVVKRYCADRAGDAEYWRTVFRAASTVDDLKIRPNAFSITHFEAFVSFFRAAVSDGPFEGDLLCETVWSDRTAQFVVLMHAIASPNVAFTSAEPELASPGPSTFGCAKLVSTLVQLSTQLPHGYERVMGLFAHDVEHNPEATALAAVRAKTDLDAFGLVVRRELASRCLISSLCRDDRSSDVETALGRVWKADSDLLVGVVSDVLANERGPRRVRARSAISKFTHVTDVLARIPLSDGLEVLCAQSSTIEKRLSEIAAKKIKAGERLFLLLRQGYSFIESDGDGLPSGIPQSVLHGLQQVHAQHRSALTKLQVEELVPKLEAAKKVVDDEARAERRLAASSSSAPQEGKKPKPVAATPPPAAQVVVPTQAVAPAAPVAGDDDASRRSKASESRANATFQKLYDGAISVQRVIDDMARLKSSRVPEDRETFGVMVVDLFDEWRWLGDYPERELRTTAVLFGSLVRRRLLESFSLGFALRCVLEALSDPENEKMVDFGATALSCFVPLMSEFPQLGAHVVALPHLQETRPKLVETVDRALRDASSSMARKQSGESSDDLAVSLSTEKLQRRLGGGESTSSSMQFAEAGRATSLSLRGTENAQQFHTLCEQLDVVIGVPEGDSNGEVPAPDEETEDAFHFLINNLTKQNVEAKVREVSNLLKPTNMQWMANYLVSKRVATQQNFHSVYLEFLKGIDSPELFTQVRIRTLANVRKLLRSNKIVSSTTERSLLKNLGSWLGKLTLARNLPLLQREIDLKALLFDGYERGWLIAVVPFTAKVLEAVTASRVFLPPNPWVMKLVKTLIELYSVPDLKLNLKFEIELLCRNLGVNVAEIDASDQLSRLRRPMLRSNPDFNVKSGSAHSSPRGGPLPLTPPLRPSQPQAQTTGANVATNEPAYFGSPVGGSTSFSAASSRTSPKRAPSTSFETVIPNLAAYVSVHPDIELFALRPELKRLVPVAVDRAIREIIQPVVERSVTIACITTKKLAVKDFAMEPDEHRLKHSAHLMVSHLASSLAHVTCKEPLRAKIGLHIRQLLSQVDLSSLSAESSAQMIEKVVSVCSGENLELGCMLIEKAATEKAMRDVDVELASQYAVRSMHRERNAQPFYDRHIFNNNQRYPSGLPEGLRPRPVPGGLSKNQLAVYEAFQRVQKKPVAVASAAAHPAPLQAPAPPSSSTSPTQTITSQQALERWKTILNALEQSVQDIVAANAGSPQEMSLKRLGPNADIARQLEEMGAIASSIAPEGAKNDVVVAFAKRIFSLLFEQSADVLRTEVQVAVLDALSRALGGRLRTRLTEYLTIVLQSQPKASSVVAASLVDANLIVTSNFDQFLATMLADVKLQPTVVPVATYLIDRCLLSTRSWPLSSAFKTLGVLQTLAQDPKADPMLGVVVEKALRLVHESRQKREASQRDSFSFKKPKSKSSSKTISALMAWITSSSDAFSPKTTDAALKEVRIAVSGGGKGNSSSSISSFLRESLEWLMDEYRESRSYASLDEYCVLLLVLLNHADPKSRVFFFHEVVDAATSTLRKELVERKAASQETEALFDQRPYFRHFLHLQKELVGALAATDESLEFDGLCVLATAYDRLLNPLEVPGFAHSFVGLISHASMAPVLLESEKGWPTMNSLLTRVFQFLGVFLNDSACLDRPTSVNALPRPVAYVYRGALVMALVLLHDFPSFLCAFSFGLCDAIPIPCVQLRNIVLSAFPPTSRLPDPFTPNLKVDLLPEVKLAPRFMCSHTKSLERLSNGLGSLFMAYLDAPSNRFLSVVVPMLKYNAVDDVPPFAPSKTWNVPALHAIVVTTAVRALAQASSSSSSDASVGLIASSYAPVKNLFEVLVNELDAEGRFHLFNCIVNQLRYPSSHTHFFSCVVLDVFREKKSNPQALEQITRSLVERVIVQRPHPWGLLITFIELIKNPRYSFWKLPGISATPEIEAIFQSVASACLESSTAA